MISIMKMIESVFFVVVSSVKNTTTVCNQPNMTFGYSRARSLSHTKKVVVNKNISHRHRFQHKNNSKHCNTIGGVFVFCSDMIVFLLLLVDFGFYCSGK
jgi:hypothetical protein